MKLFHADASPKSDKSTSRMLAQEFRTALHAKLPGLSVDYLDLSLSPPPHVTGAWAKATYTPEAERTDEMRAVLADSDALCARLLAADALLFSMPMYNWSMPSSFKAFIDAIVRAGVTYISGANGYGGRLAGRKVLFITSRGADLRSPPWAGLDALTPALRAAFGFLGVQAPDFIDAQPMQFAAAEEREAGLQRARAEIAAMAALWARVGEPVCGLGV